MKKVFRAILFGLMAFALSACGTDNPETSVTSTSEQTASETESASSAATEDQEEVENAVRRISVQFGENVVIYELNGGTAATSLYEQLPLTIEVEDFSTNEKIFYPPEELDTSNSPLAQTGAGTLAYYAPWGDVVMFYGDYNENPSLYELGQVVSHGELVREMSGTIIIDIAE